MCNLYSLTRGQDAIRELFKIDRDATGNQPPLASIWPDYPAPVVRLAADGARELVRMRWGFPPPPKSKERCVTNVRNTASSWWRPSLTPAFRCLVPFTAFCEYTDSLPKVAHWFALSEDRPLAAFAGIWRTWGGVRGTKKDPVVGEHLLYSFLTTNPNTVVQPIHAKAMPVILTQPEEFETWLAAPVEEALALQRPLPAELLKIVASGSTKDEGPVALAV